MMADAASLSSVSPPLVAQLAVFEALLLAASALHKASRWPDIQMVAMRFARLPRALAFPGLIGVMAVELIAAVLLVNPSSRRLGGLMAGALWTLYLAFIVRALLENRGDVDCGCSFASSDAPLGTFQVARNSLLALLSLGVFWGAAGPLQPAVQASQWLGGVALLALYGSVDQVKALRPLRRGEIL